MSRAVKERGKRGAVVSSFVFFKENGNSFFVIFFLTGSMSSINFSPSLR